MRTRSRIIQSLEAVYREAYTAAEESEDAAQMRALDFGFQRDQVLLEVMLDLRQVLDTLDKDEAPEESSLLDKAKAIRKFTKLTGR